MATGGRWVPCHGSPLLTWLPLLHHTVSQPPITSPPQHHVSTLWAVAHSSGCQVLGSHPPILIPPPLPVITHMHQPSSLWAVASSGGVWCHRCQHLPLIPVIILSCIGSAGAGAGGIGGGVLDAHHHGGPLAPNPPCKQGLAVVGGRCWCLYTPGILVELHLWSTLQVACRHGVGAIGHCWCCSTCDPPHEQLLVRLGWCGQCSVLGWQVVMELHWW